MGSFSWLKADVTTNKANIVEGDKFACLIPEEFGGGYIVDNYRDYGYLYDKENKVKYDMYELLAFWNKEITSDKLQYDGEFPNLKPIDKYTDNNRGLGIDIGCYDMDMDSLKYPLKLVSEKYAKTHTYEDCPNKSFGDPIQGFSGLTWKSLIKERFNARICVGFYKLLQDRLSYIKNDDKKFEEINFIENFLTRCRLTDNDLVSKRETIADEMKISKIVAEATGKLKFIEKLENLEKSLNEVNEKIEKKQNKLNDLKISLSSDDINKMDEIERD